jgi:hypothetical protein
MLSTPTHLRGLAIMGGPRLAGVTGVPMFLVRPVLWGEGSCKPGVVGSVCCQCRSTGAVVVTA